MRPAQSRANAGRYRGLPVAEQDRAVVGLLDDHVRFFGWEPNLKRLSLLALAFLPGCVPGAEQRAVSAGDLPPIPGDYRARIAGWARHYYAQPSALGDPALSEPVLTRDSTGRLLWLVCLDVDAGPNAGGRQLQAFGFAPGYASFPLDRRGSSLSRDDCRSAQLTWRAWPGLRTAR